MDYRRTCGSRGQQVLRHIYLLFKNESHGESDCLEKQKHAENAEKLQERKWRTEADLREVFVQQPGHFAMKTLQEMNRASYAFSLFPTSNKSIIT